MRPGARHRMKELNRPRQTERCPAVTSGVCKQASCHDQEFLCHMCGQWQPWCMGHSTGVECSECWYKMVLAMLKFIRDHKRPTRIQSVYRKFTQPGWSRKRIREELNELVDEGKVWHHDGRYVARNAA